MNQEPRPARPTPEAPPATAATTAATPGNATGAFPAFNPYAPPAAPPTLPSVSERGDDQEDREGLDVDGFPRGSRIAGWLFLAHGLVLFLDMFVSQAGQPRAVASAVIDFVVGVGLLGGKEKYRRWALWRMGLGAVMVVLQATGGSDLSAWVVVPNLLAFGGIATCLIGRPGTARIVAGCSAFAALVAVEALGILVLSK